MNMMNNFWRGNTTGQGMGGGLGILGQLMQRPSMAGMQKPMMQQTLPMQQS